MLKGRHLPMFKNFLTHFSFLTYGAHRYITHITGTRGESKPFFKSPQIANPQILRLNLQSQIRKFLWYASPQIVNMQIFIMNCKSQIRKFLQNTVQLCLKTVLKVVFFTRFFIMYKF
jgi:hypothetical protein